MPAVFWFLLGAAVVLAWHVVRIAHVQRPAPQPLPPPLPISLVAEVTDAAEQLQTLAAGVGRELADLATGIEGQAQRFCESLGDPPALTSAAERLWGSVRKLRLFSEKLLSFSTSGELSLHAVDVAKLLRALREELATHWTDGLRMELSTASHLPAALANRQALRAAVTFLVDTLLAIEPETSRISLSAYTSVDEDQNPVVEVEIAVDAEEHRGPPNPLNHQAQLGFVAAQNLLEAQHALLALNRIEGHCVVCTICLSAAVAAAPGEEGALDPDADRQAEVAGPPPPPEPEPATHGYGGVLILEDDRAMRAMLAAEIERTGRSLITCADGASASSLLAATPERFELLILDQDARIERGERIASRALATHPHLRVLLLATRPTRLQLARDAESRLAVLHKPFGLTEFREMVGALLGTASAASRV